MKKFILATIAVCAVSAAHAGAVVAYEPIDVTPEGESSATAALLLLAMIGVVIASGTMGSMATRGKTTMLPEEPEDM